jgi:hypothetical protein
VRPTTALSLGVLAVLALIAAPAGASAESVWGGCPGGAELSKPAKVQYCTRDVSYSLYVDSTQWASFGADQATGIGTAYVNPCDVSCKYGVWYPSGSASVTLSKPKACGDRRIYTHGLIQLQTPYQGRTVYEESYPCQLVFRECRARLFNGSIRGIAQRATTCLKAAKVASGWAKAADYRTHATLRKRVKSGVYACRSAAKGKHQLAVTCRASKGRIVRFRASR